MPTKEKLLKEFEEGKLRELVEDFAFDFADDENQSGRTNAEIEKEDKKNWKAIMDCLSSALDTYGKERFREGQTYNMSDEMRSAVRFKRPEEIRTQTLDEAIAAVEEYGRTCPFHPVAATAVEEILSTLKALKK